MPEPEDLPLPDPKCLIYRGLAGWGGVLSTICPHDFVAEALGTTTGEGRIPAANEESLQISQHIGDAS